MSHVKYHQYSQRHNSISILFCTAFFFYHSFNQNRNYSDFSTFFFFSHYNNDSNIVSVFENREKMVLVMEFAAGGELYDYLSERKVLSEEEARRIFRQISTAVYYCHKHKICHRDLKLENILLDEHGNAKVSLYTHNNNGNNKKKK